MSRLALFGWTVAFALAGGSPVVARADHLPGLPTPAVTEGHVFDLLGHPHEGALVVYGNQATFTDASGYWVFRRPFPYWRQVQASKVVNGRLALCCGWWSDRSLATTTSFHAYHDFYLPFEMDQPQITPEVVRAGAGSLITVRVNTYAPAAESVVRSDLGDGTMAFEAVDADGFSWWSQTYTVPPDTPEGHYRVKATAYASADGRPISECGLWCYRSFWVDGTAPAFSEAAPVGWTSESAPEISIRIAASAAGIDPASPRVALNGVALQAVYTPESEFAGRLSATASPLPDGQHTVEVSAADTVGNVSTFTYAFLVDTAAPGFGPGRPSGTIGERTPLIEVTVSDVGSGINPAAIEMSLSDGLRTSRLAAAWDPAGGRVLYQVPALPNGPGPGEGALLDGTYSVDVRVSDSAGNLGTTNWGFVVRSLDLDG